MVECFPYQELECLRASCLPIIDELSYRFGDNEEERLALARIRKHNLFNLLIDTIVENEKERIGIKD